MRAHQIVGQSCQEKTHVVACVHPARRHLAPVLRPLFRHERAAHGPLAADPHARKQPKHCKLPALVLR